MNSRLASLQTYPFQKLAELLRHTSPAAGKSAIHLTMGEPRHPAPDFVLKALTRHLDGLSHYPLTRGMA